MREATDFEELHDLDQRLVQSSKDLGLAGRAFIGAPIGDIQRENIRNYDLMLSFHTELQAQRDALAAKVESL